MRKPLSVGFIAAVAAVVPIATGGAQTTVLDFEDLQVPSCCIASMPMNYGGISWDPNFGHYGVPQWPFTPHSGNVRVGTNQVAGGLDEVFFQFLSPQVFNGAWFAGALNLGVTVRFNLYSGSTLVGSSAILPTTPTPTFLASGFTGTVDRVGIVGYRGLYVFDDLTYSAAVTSTPEPATFGLLATGLVGLGAVARRRRRA